MIFLLPGLCWHLRRLDRPDRVCHPEVHHEDGRAPARVRVKPPRLPGQPGRAGRHRVQQEPVG